MLFFVVNIESSSDFALIFAIVVSLLLIVNDTRRLHALDLYDLVIILAQSRVSFSVNSFMSIEDIETNWQRRIFVDGQMEAPFQ